MVYPRPGCREYHRTRSLPRFRVSRYLCLRSRGESDDIWSPRSEMRMCLNMRLSCCCSPAFLFLRKQRNSLKPLPEVDALGPQAWGNEETNNSPYFARNNIPVDAMHGVDASALAACPTPRIKRSASDVAFALANPPIRRLAMNQKSRNAWPSERPLSSKQQPCLFACSIYQSASTVPCGIRLVFPQARPTETTASCCRQK